MVVGKEEKLKKEKPKKEKKHKEGKEDDSQTAALENTSPQPSAPEPVKVESAPEPSVVRRSPLELVARVFPFAEVALAGASFALSFIITYSFLEILIVLVANLILIVTSVAGRLALSIRNTNADKAAKTRQQAPQGT
jgi:hypothetical protein